MASERVILDSSVLVAFYDEGDALHAAAMQVGSVLQSRECILHPYVIQETATVLTYRFGPVVALRFCDDIAGASNVSFAQVTLEKDIAYFRHITKKMSFTDIALVRLAKELQVPLVTFDKQIIALMRNMNR